MAKKWLLIILFYLHLRKIDTAKILAVFPTPSISHQLVFRRLTDGLVSRGHEVTVITTDPAYPKEQAPANLNEIDVHEISYKIWREEIEKSTMGSAIDLYTQVNILIRAHATVLKCQIETPEVQDIIKKKSGEYDLLLLEAWVKPALIFSNVFKIPVIQISSMGAFDYNLKPVGAPTHPLLYPSQLHQRLYKLSKWDKIHEIYKHISFEICLNRIEDETNSLLKTIFGPSTPSINELSKNVDMLFLNVHPIWVENQPVPPSVVYIGGIHKNPPKDLPKDLQNYLDSSKNGVIYFSLGTNVIPSLLPPEKIQVLIKVFSELPYDVLWKWDKDDLRNRSKNIKIFKWLPQSDLLRHQNIKLFITQGGLQSTDEAIDAGVPLIGMPMLGDQWYNVEKYSRHGIGLRLDLESLTENQLKNAILAVIKDKSFRENIAKLRTIMEDQPQSPLERAVWWTEHVLRHGGAKHLRAATANVSWSEYLELELISIVITVAITMSLFLYIFLRFAIKLLISFKHKIKVN